jgi:hypothetical protein
MCAPTTRGLAYAALELGRWVFLAPLGYINTPRAMGKSLTPDPKRLARSETGQARLRVAKRRVGAASFACIHERRMVALTSVSWNRVAFWLRLIAAIDRRLNPTGGRRFPSSIMRRHPEFLMTPERSQKVKDICSAVLGRDAAERSALLEHLCAGDEELRREVRVMIADACKNDSVQAQAAGRATATHTAGAAQSGAAVPVHTDWTPGDIDGFRILRVVGEGGMGVVYEARQQEPSRTVALKVIRPGLATPEVLRRFRQEAHALGRLQHSGIAQIYATGTADTAFGPQPYFVMEFILGQLLRAYVEQNRLSVAQRLELVAHICDAVHHAHQRGLIHRDLNQICPRWNPLTSWMRQIEDFQRAA